MSDAPDLGPLPQRVAVDADQVRRLVADQFPQWAGLPVRPVVNGGWDNWTFHLGPRMSVRLPSAAEYALAVDKEHRWLPALAPVLPLPVPTPLAQGGWALWKTLVTCAGTLGDAGGSTGTDARRVLGEIFVEDTAGTVRKPTP